MDKSELKWKGLVEWQLITVRFYFFCCKILRYKIRKFVAVLNA